jgi:peptidoglycan/LPS O-acetylase OafA/YrhL
LHAVSYTTNYSGGSWVLGHLWSLSVEEQFYLIWPAVLLLLGWRRSVAGVAVFILALPAARLGFRLFPSACTACQAFVPVWADGIAVGCLLAAARGQLNAQRLYRSFKGSAWFLAVPVAVVLGTVLSAYPNAWSPLITRTLTNICIALIIDRSIDVPRDLAGRMLNSRPMCFIGVLSYSLYLWQQPFLDHYSSSLVCTFPLNILLALGAALASYYAVEKPFLAWRKKLERRWFTAPDVRGHDAVVLV